MSFVSKIFGDANSRYIKSLEPIIEKINELEKDFERLSDSELKDKTSEFKNLLATGYSLDDLLPQAFAAVREAAKRTLGQRHYDVQLIGGIVMHQGKIAEMRTGEGKTLVATLPTYLNALTGKGAHVVSVNDYLVRRDTAWMGQIYDALGLTVGCITHEASYQYDASHITKSQDETEDTEGSFKVVHELLRPITRREAYGADITYGTNNEYGFDYLRDNMAYAQEQMSQRVHSSRSTVHSEQESSVNSKLETRNSHAFAIVDEVDSILIDEARTPLIISAPDEDSGSLYQTFSKIVPKLQEGDDYSVDIKHKTVSITETGIEKVESMLGLTNIYDEGGINYVHHLEQALKAHVIFSRDRDYVVKDGEIIIVDEFTGRLMPGRRWSEGLHQAIEAKEGVKVQRESRTLATITFQNYFRLYEKLAGMTGTAQSSAEEFHKIYSLDVVSIPTNKPAIRKDLPDKIFKNETGKFRAIVQEIKARHQNGQPLLVGTVSIEKNEHLSLLLEREGVPHVVLNAKNHEKEAELHAQAGRPGAVTIATNIAGRGVDIILGGNPPLAEDAELSRKAGGLHVIGTERHEARRIDDQLRGRSGRQGDPGSSQFFVSTEDELVRRFGGDRLKNIMERLGVGEDDVIENRFVSNAIQQAQARIEGYNLDSRKYVLEYDDVMNKHRRTIYDLRRKILFGENSKPVIEEYLSEFFDNVVRFHTASYEWDAKNLKLALESVAGPDAELDNKISEFAGRRDAEGMLAYVQDYISARYASRENELGLEQMRALEKLVLLRTIDELWIDHISAMEHLRDTVRLRAYGQRDPLAEYKIEAQRVFGRLMESIKAQVVNVIFKVSMVQKPKEVKAVEGRANVEGQNIVERESQRAAAVHRLESEKIGRNDPCPCGAINPATGEVYKWKKCGMINAPHHKK
ncbi:MAG: preprotein translocase subunit SecA [Candidatus Yanofskybacteria bacterium RIFCSPHIGHO2_01_FULL_48_25b]|uniref:Protein translocase subunit SecA n=1 Tax=Candidatus Yanofskybacteria bacterium RIFCSPHIGHO2_01_FULL_48_25b TaxID=1802672 RepID=A0A1F8F113_9BACT|nr:MAG: preprotein translocase subunit SecA [Candidatus Yanofskybacteria bacterium RIFCSPHIGHO2_01_FULL_48_25b]